MPPSNSAATPELRASAAQEPNNEGNLFADLEERERKICRGHIAVIDDVWGKDWAKDFPRSIRLPGVPIVNWGRTCLYQLSRLCKVVELDDAIRLLRDKVFERLEDPHRDPRRFLIGIDVDSVLKDLRPSFKERQRARYRKDMDALNRFIDGDSSPAQDANEEEEDLPARRTRAKRQSNVTASATQEEEPEDTTLTADSPAPDSTSKRPAYSLRTIDRKDYRTPKIREWKRQTDGEPSPKKSSTKSTPTSGGPKPSGTTNEATASPPEAPTQKRKRRRASSPKGRLPTRVPHPVLSDAPVGALTQPAVAAADEPTSPAKAGATAPKRRAPRKSRGSDVGVGAKAAKGKEKKNEKKEEEEHDGAVVEDQIREVELELREVQLLRRLHELKRMKNGE